MLAQTRREPARAHGSLVVQRSGRDSNPRDELTPPTRFPVVLLQPLGHHSRGLPVSHGGRPGMPGQRFSRCERLLGRRGHLRRPGQGRSFPLAPSASRSRLKLRRGTEAFRGNGTPAEWTKRQAFGHFLFRTSATPRRGARGPRSPAFHVFPLRALFGVARDLRRRVRRRTFALAPDAESNADEAPPGCWKSFGTKARQRSGGSERIAFGATRFRAFSAWRA